MTREEICNSMTLQDAIQVFRDTNAYGTMDIAKSVILKALEQQPSEDEKIIRIKKGTLKARTGRYVIYDVEWLKTHFNTTEAKIYGQPQPSDNLNAVLDELNRIGRNAFKDDTDYDNLFDFISNLPNVKPQSEKRTEEGTETHACDCISRKAVLESLHRKFADGFDSDRWWNSTVVLYAISELLSVTPQSKEESQQKTGHWIEHKYGAIEHIECSECRVWFLKADLPRKSYCPNCGSCNGDMIKNIMRDITKKQ